MIIHNFINFLIIPIIFTINFIKIIKTMMGEVINLFILFIIM